MIWTSNHPSVPVGGTTVPALLEGAAVRFAERTALVDGPSGRSVTYAELWRRVDRIAAWLVDDGFRPGDRLGLWLPNTPPFVALALAAMQAGGAVTAVNPAATEHEAATQLADASVSVLATLPDLVPSARRLGLRRVIALGAAADSIPLDELLRSDAPSVPCAAGEDEIALIPYSSGTTGLPKGVLLSHANLVTVTRQMQAPLQVGPEDVTLAVAPLFHILGFTAELLAPLSAGACVVTMDRFSPELLVELLSRHRVTYAAVPPPVVNVLLGHPAAAGHDLPDLRFLGCGGAALAPPAQKAMARRFPACTVGQGWGLTETSGAICIPDRDVGSRPGTVAQLLPNTELTVLDPATGAALDEGADGELCVRGPQVMVGYLGRGDDTAAMIDGDGWLHTGDLGHVDPDGSVVIVDRLKDLIKVNAFQVAPAELEQVLLSRPDIADAAVVGVPDERTGEAPVAFVVAREGVLDVDELAAWVAARVAPYKRLADVRLVDHVPRSPSGKVLRRMLTSA